MESKKPHHPHDKFFKTIFSKKEMVIEYIEKLLPKELSKQLHFDSLLLEPTSYISEQQEALFSDIVYSCEYGAKNDQILVTLLFEHKSVPEKYPHFQLLEYLLQIWKQQAANNDPLTLVIPILFYHGEKKWRYKDISSYFNTKPDVFLQQFIPNFNYLLTDLSQYSEEQLFIIEIRFLLNAFLAMKNCRNPKYLKAEFSKPIVTENDYYFKEILVYLLKNLHLEKDKNGLVVLLENAEENLKKNIMTLYDQLINEGLEKGLEKGVAKGDHNRLVDTILSLQTELSLDVIASTLKVSKSFVQEVIDGKIKKIP